MNNSVLRLIVGCSFLAFINCGAMVRTFSPQYDLDRCAEENNRDCAAKALDRWYAIPRPKTLQALHIAAKKNFVEMADFLISKGAEPNGKNRQGVSAVHVATMYGQPTMLKFLIEKNGDPSLREKSGANAFDMAVAMITALHHTPDQAIKIQEELNDTLSATDEQMAKNIGARYLECYYFLAGRKISLSDETVREVKKIKLAADKKPNTYTPYFEEMYKHLETTGLLRTL